MLNLMREKLLTKKVLSKYGVIITCHYIISHAVKLWIKLCNFDKQTNK